MKKKILLFIGLFLVFISLGCSNGKTKEVASDETKFENMVYKKPKGLVKVEDNSTGSTAYKINFLRFDEEDKSITLCWYKDKKWTEVGDESLTYQMVTINSQEWRTRKEKMGNLYYATYITEYKGDTYIVELNGTNKYEKELDEYIQNTRFN